MAEIKTHQISSKESNIRVFTEDEPGKDGSFWHYRVSFGDPRAPDSVANLHIRFQNGDIKTMGVNGITTEALLAVVLDRIKNDYLCRNTKEDGKALDAIELGLLWLKAKEVK